MRRLPVVVLPGGLILLAALVFLRLGVLPDWVHPYLRAYPYVVAGAGLFLGWLLNRNRVVFAVLVLTLADRALVQFAPGGSMPTGVGHTVFNAVSILLPLNLVAFAMLSERGILNMRGLGRLVFILAQCLLVAAVCRPAQQGIAAWLDYRIGGANLTSWTALSQPALLAFGLALVAQGVRTVLHRYAIEGGFLWALAASFIALHADRVGWPATNYFATAGLILVAALFETSHRMSYHDDLTELPGRRALNETLPKLGDRYAVAMVDIDHFRQFNDRYGHEVGDQVLRMVATKLGGESGGGRAFRFGGEEFAILFPSQSAEDVIPHLESLRKAVQASCFVLRGWDRPRKKPDTPKSQSGPRRAVVVTVSIGVAERNARNAKPAQVINAADKALYRAKEAGRNQVSV